METIGGRAPEQVIVEDKDVEEERGALLLKGHICPRRLTCIYYFIHLAQHLSYFLIHKGIHLLSYCVVISTAKLCWLSLDSACFHFWADKNCSGPPSLGLCGGNRTFSLFPSNLSLSACNVGDLGLIPGSGRSPGEGKGYPLQYSGLENSICHGI
ncbi:unnamed protein product [Rangifer tarandus platyrhynchus]|uniref:Uncharacterized protein n=2 Tax=Rangifer tarandus platyrhynchus TaxID=3082113 RepID=A0AC60A1G3_RANTA|nr:unnamed protein product [Rangifer tarandus platyrhynchus]